MDPVTAAALQAVLDLHVAELVDGVLVCSACSWAIAADRNYQAWPCPTIQVIEQAGFIVPRIE